MQDRSYQKQHKGKILQTTEYRTNHTVRQVRRSAVQHTICYIGTNNKVCIIPGQMTRKNPVRSSSTGNLGYITVYQIYLLRQLQGRPQELCYMSKHSKFKQTNVYKLIQLKQALVLKPILKGYNLVCYCNRQLFLGYHYALVRSCKKNWLIHHTVKIYFVVSKRFYDYFSQYSLSASFWEAGSGSGPAFVGHFGALEGPKKASCRIRIHI